MSVRGLARRVAGGMVCAAALAGASAHAGEKVAVTYSGTVTAMYDPSGIFGAPGAFPAYVDTFIFDLGVGVTYSAAGQLSVWGGSLNSIPSPLIDSRLTINGVTVDFPGGSSDEQDTYFGSSVDSSSDLRDPSIGWLSNFDTIAVDAPTSLAQNFFGTVTDPSQSWGEFLNCPLLYSCHRADDRLWGLLAPETVRITVLGVPEPSSWALFISGFVGLGALLRRRRALA